MRPLTYATVCSGVECMGAAVADLPMSPVFFSEIEPFPCAVLRHRYPNVPNLGDMSKIRVSQDGKEVTNGTDRVLLGSRLDILAGGTPCQDVSTDGLRRGMSEGSGTRSSLAFEFVRLVRELRPRYVIWENVAGVLSDPSFPGFLSALAECGYGLAYRVLDAQWTRCADIHHPDGGVVRLERAVPQRRRRVWVVGCAGGDVRRASEILFEREGAAGDRPPRRVAGQGPAEAPLGRARLPDRVVGAEGFDPYEPGGVKPLNPGHAGTLINGACPGCHSGVVEVYENHAQDCRVKPCGEVAPTLNGKMGTGGNNVPLKAECFVKVSHARGADGLGERWERGECAGTRNAIEGGDGRSQECVVERRVPCRVRKVAVCHDGDACLSINTKQMSMDVGDNVSATLVSTMYTEPEAVCTDVCSIASMRFVVRRLTPTECERLMGLRDGWTLPAFAPGEITDALVEEFRRIHDAYGAIMAAYEGRPAPRPKTAAWVRRWLERISDPETCPDAPRYKACGNGWAANQPRWIVLRLLFFEGIDPWNRDETTEPTQTKGTAS